ncbi:type I-F CRISPR-associated endoribonuclease Cas6/Csy4 [Pseudomonas lopnurensis]|uniref:type I-F CRISPR-associated endoribonuclease Cas6/Csy4 n=1 Tax=Pseudomonas lopnurensis TaxID=1477517 RepID=UPI0028A62AE2|nr:type I-F CRISPR-associated endoribonuclease Cas6/Csy4 [Pseudomonas lopnurensis]
MDHYLDIHLLPDPEFSAGQLMNALFAKLHRALVQLGSDSIGVSFPKARDGAAGLGGHLRLHGCLAALDDLLALPWLTGMRDHVRLGEAAPVPADARHCRVRRVQADSNPERLRRRAMKRHGLSEDQARERIPDAAVKWLRLPYLQLRSQSTGQPFRLFIEQSPPQPEPRTGAFNTYGLSRDATVPWF